MLGKFPKYYKQYWPLGNAICVMKIQHPRMGQLSLILFASRDRFENDDTEKHSGRQVIKTYFN